HEAGGVGADPLAHVAAAVELAALHGAVRVAVPGHAEPVVIGEGLEAHAGAVGAEPSFYAGLGAVVVGDLGAPRARAAERPGAVTEPRLVHAGRAAALLPGPVLDAEHVDAMVGDVAGGVAADPLSVEVASDVGGDHAATAGRPLPGAAREHAVGAVLLAH